MEEKKKTNPVIIILIILLLGSFSYIGYNEFIVKDNNAKENNNKDETTTEEKVTYKDYQEEIGPENEYTVYYKFTTNDNYVSKVSIKDLSSLLVDIGSEYFTMKYVVLIEGKVYYYFENGVNKEEYITRYFDLIDISNNDDNIKLNELSGLSGKVKRIKSANMTSGMDVSQLLIMEDGSVYSLSLNINNEPTLLKMDELSKYKVDDIISWHTSSDGADYKVVFTDGTILEKTID